MRRLTWLLIMVLAVLVVCGGCTTLTEYEKADARNRMIADYDRCKASRTFWVEDGDTPLPRRQTDLKRELVWNNCPRTKL